MGDDVTALAWSTSRRRDGCPVAAGNVHAAATAAVHVRVLCRSNGHIPTGGVPQGALTSGDVDIARRQHFELSIVCNQLKIVAALDRTWQANGVSKVAMNTGG